MADTRTIYQRLADITNEIPVVAKELDVSVGAGKRSYKAVSERSVLDTVKPLERKHGVYSYPAQREVIESNLLQKQTDYGPVTTLMTRIRTTYRFVNIDNPADFVETVTFSEGMDSQDKGSGKAMTYGDKYALMKMYKISTGDDPDAAFSEDSHYERPQANAKASNQSETLYKWGQSRGLTAEDIEILSTSKYKALTKDLSKDQVQEMLEAIRQDDGKLRQYVAEKKIKKQKGKK